MATSGNISDIRGIVDSYGEEQCRKLYDQWRKDIEDSNTIIAEIEFNPTYIEKNIDQIITMVERLNKELDYYSELGVDIETPVNLVYGFSEIRRNLEKNYRTLSLSFYKHNFDMNKIQYQESRQSLDEIKESQKTIEKNMGNIDNRVESLGATFLNIVLTISITSTMVTVLLKSTPRYSLSIVLGCAWLLLSSIIFISSYFKNDNKKTNSKIPWIIYLSLTTVTIIAFIFGWYSEDKTKIINEENLNQKEVSQPILNPGLDN